MTVTVSLYDHTSLRFVSGANGSTDVYKLILCTEATFDAANTTLDSIVYTETAAGNGYVTGGQELTGVSFLAATTNDAKFTADTVSWSATGGTITASYAILFNETDSNNPPILFIDFGNSETALDGTDLRVLWSESGIVTFTVT
jgi:hypothetical protein